MKLRRGHSLGREGRSPWGVSKALALLSLLPALVYAEPKQPPAEPTPCVSYRAEARFRLGYDHLVHVTNACPRDVQCVVRTNVNQSGVETRVAPQQTETVLTFRGSPASTFETEVSCRWAS